MQLTRRSMLLAGAATLAAGAAPRAVLAASPHHFESAAPFTESMVREAARALADAPYAAPQVNLPISLQTLSYDQYRDIRFAPPASLWREERLPFEVQFFHMGRDYREPVDVNIVSGGQSRHLRFSPDMFTYGRLIDERPDGRDLGFAGFRVHTAINNPDYLDEFVVFQGASYFRAVARGQAYGLSARGLALNTGDPGGEEFPVFRKFWIEEPAPEADFLVVHALLDSPRIAGAYRFVLHAGDETVTEVRATLYPRVEIDQVGIAPLTSMFFFGPHDRVGVDDFRPAVHDSEGLAIRNGAGEQLWRPLLNPDHLLVSAFTDRSPRGFGLVQRNRGFGHYQDLEAAYERRPSLWVEPQGDWGEGAVMLFEIPSDTEADDNIVASWRPQAPLAAHQPFEIAYRLRWGGDVPADSALARVTRSMVGRAGAGLRAHEVTTRVVVVEFDAAALEGFAPEDIVAEVFAGPEPVDAVLQVNPFNSAWRVSFELPAAPPAPVELRCALRRETRPVSEIWTCRWPIGRLASADKPVAGG